MTVQLPAAAKADILRRLAGALEESGIQPGAKTNAMIDELCNEYGMLPAEVKALVQKHGWPKPESMRRAADIITGVQPRPSTTAPVPTTHGHLLTRAAKSSKARIKNLGAKIEALFDELEALVKEEEARAQAAAAAQREKAAARAEVERLEQELAAARAKLKGSGTSAAKIRAWARDSHVDCPATGRVPASVAAEYFKAHA